jgi:hypothetical protein
MNGKVKILFFCMIFVAGRAFCQKTGALMPLHPVLFYYKQAGLTQQKTTVTVSAAVASKKVNPAFSFIPSSYSLQVITPDYYTSNFGYFCKKELQLEKITKLPFKFRLGSVEQCDWLEGKRTVISQ